MSAARALVLVEVAYELLPSDGDEDMEYAARCLIDALQALRIVVGR